MSSVNLVIIVGHLGTDPELRTMSNGEVVANIRVATSENWIDRYTNEKRENTEWHRCVLYRRLAEIAGQYLRKGAKVYLEGKLTTRKWQDQQGIARTSTEIVVNKLQMLDRKAQDVIDEPWLENSVPQKVKNDAEQLLTPEELEFIKDMQKPPF